MATEWTAPQLARAMHRAGWAALLMLLPITVDGRSVVGGPLAIVVAVLVWRMAAVAPHRARVALGVASGAMLATGAALLIAWLPAADPAGVAMVSLVFACAACTAYATALAEWLGTTGWPGAIARFRWAAGLAASSGLGIVAYVSGAVVLGSAAPTPDGAPTLTVGMTDIDATVVFDRVPPGLSSASAATVVTVLVIGASAGALLMSSANRTTLRRLLGLTSAGGPAKGSADVEPGESVAP